MNFKTEQENFWRGDFGTEYCARNDLSPGTLAARVSFWSTVLHRIPHALPTSILECGANIGINLHALSILLPQAELHAIEINPAAAETLRAWGRAEVHETSILEFAPTRTWDFVFTSGVLIHIAPEALPQVYATMHNASHRHVFLAEYYNPVPVEIPYRGFSGRLFKRDFAGEMLDAYPSLALHSYGFAYHRDVSQPLDDLTWFLLEKRGH